MRILFGLWLLLAAMVTTLMAILVTMIANSVLSIIWMLLKNATKHLGTAGLELWVMLTTEMFVIRFLLDFFGPWYADSCMTCVVLTIESLNYTMVHYTMGLMQLSAAKVNDYFQVWAVLLVTLQYSVKIGRPYTRSKQVPLQDLVSSFWAANLIRVQTFFYLRISLWTLWALNAARIIAYFSASDKAEAINQESTRIVADYMSYEHELAAADATGSGDQGLFNMKRYKYVVLGEDKVLKKGLDDPDAAPARRQEQVQRRRRVLWLDPEKHEELITVDKIWEYVVDADGGCGANRLRDLCLSFSLYKLLRRRFYNLPIHEAVLREPAKKIKKLIFGYILHDDAERAFRVVAAELSFLQDTFYSKRAALFAAGFPAANLALSLLLVAAAGYVAYAVHYIPDRMAEADRGKITHGLFITRIIIGLIIVKEVMEIYMYAFSQWAKVLMLCNYAEHRGSRHRLVAAAMRVMLRLMRWRSWDERIRQLNLLASSRVVKLGRLFRVSHYGGPRAIKLEACTKEAIFESLKRLEQNPEGLGSYFSNAWGEEQQGELGRADRLEADTHKILVWHIATCLREIQLYENFPALSIKTRGPWPFAKKPRGADGDSQHQQLVEHYTTACSLSNYCAYLVTQRLVPDSSLVTDKVLREVRWEIIGVIFSGRAIVQPWPRSSVPRRYMRGVFTRFMDEAYRRTPDDDRDEEAAATSSTKAARGREDDGDGHPADRDDTLTRKGARLAKQLMPIRPSEEDLIVLWEKLATFWTGFLLHLAASTSAAKHKKRLAGSQELVTHLWALLSHAGFLGKTRHGHQDLDDANLVQDDVDPTGYSG